LEQQSYLQKVPIINNFIDKKAKNYVAPTGGGEVGSCAICMDDFKENDNKKVAELNCSKFHIFHVDCIKEWIKKNDTCPNCREKILNE
jgi:hypothetical protein